MTSDHLVDPEIKPVLTLLPSVAFSLETLPAMRAALIEQFNSLPVPKSPLVSVETVTIPSRDGAPPVRALLYKPRDAAGPYPALLHIHGGGYVFGNPEIFDAANRELTASLGCLILSVDYRLAPETVYPGALEDCYTALQWLTRNAAHLQIDPSRIGLKGESAGGGLAASLALLARDRGEKSIAFQHLISPMIDDRTCVEADPHPLTGEFMWTRAKNRFGWSCLLGTAPGSADISPYAAAARAGDLSGLPATFISVGALDLFLEEDVDYALRLTRAGVPVELHVYPGAFHGFSMAANARVSIAAERDSKEALRRALYG